MSLAARLPRDATDGLRAGTPDRLALPALLLVAAALRLPDLATRGTWDGDQGHDMLVLRALVRDGVIPLLGPPTSIGDVHHGAWYYYLLSPGAALTGGDQPLAVVGLIAICGVIAVGVTWWLARSMAGPLAGLVAGTLLAVSAAAIDESTFIWNPNLIALSSAVALAGAWRAWNGHHPGWWIVAAIGTAITMQCHILGIALLPIIGAPFLMDARRRPLGRTPLAVLAVFVLAYLPLAANELTHGFSETRAAVDYLSGGAGAGDTAVPVRLPIVGLRVVSWPVTGLIVDGFTAAVLATVALVVIVAWRWRSSSDRERRAVRWLGLGLAWTIVFLTVAAPSLASVVRGLPNDHYHAFADPIVVTLLGIGVAALVRDLKAPIGPAIAAISVAGLLGWNALHLPPAMNPDGGYPAGQAAADRVSNDIGSAGIGATSPVLLRYAPSFKSTEALAYPLVRAGAVIVAETPDGFISGTSAAPPAPATATTLVVLCDQLFREANGADCGGPAEDPISNDAGFGGGTTLLDRFEAAPGRWMSVYGPRPT